MKKIIIFILILIFSAPKAFCAEQKYQIIKLNLKESIDLAKKNNIDINADLININIAGNKIKAANKFKNPSLMTFYNFGQAGKGNPQQIGLSQTIEMGKRASRKNFEKANRILVKDTHNYQLFNLEMNVREAYVNLVASKTILNILEEQQSLLEELLKELKRTNKNPDEESILEIMQTEIALNVIIAKVNTAKVNIESAKLNYNKVLNLKDDNDYIDFDSKDESIIEQTDFISLLTPATNQKIPAFEEIKKQAFEKRFDIQIKKDEMEIAQKNLVMILKQKIPDLEIIGGYSFQTNHQTDGQGYFSGAYAGLGITNIPLWYNYSPEIKNAKLEYEQAKLKYESTQNIAAHQIESTYKKFLMAKINLSHYDKNIIKKSYELLNISKKSFKTGKSTLTTFILIEQSHIDVQLSYIDTLLEYYYSWIDFLRSINCNISILDSQYL